MSVAGKSTISERYWDQLVEGTRPLASTIVENRKNIRFMFRTFLGAIKGDTKGNTKVVFGTHHDSILNHIPKDAKDLSIVNIDHHHDLGYTPWQDEQARSYDICNESNWVPTLSDRISDYTWVRNPTSTPLPPTIKTEHHFRVTEVIDNTEINVDHVTWDLVYVCLSPNYTYDTHWVYFYLMLDLYENLSGIPVSIDTTRYSEHF
jgi:hypothetical protein